MTSEVMFKKKAKEKLVSAVAILWILKTVFQCIFLGTVGCVKHFLKTCHCSDDRLTGSFFPPVLWFPSIKSSRNKVDSHAFF